jgi:hypothetical protein
LIIVNLKYIYNCMYANSIDYNFTLIGDTLEIGAQWSVAKKDIPAFERYIAQLKPYYLDYSKQGNEGYHFHHGNF